MDPIYLMTPFIYNPIYTNTKTLCEFLLIVKHAA